MEKLRNQKNIRQRENRKMAKVSSSLSVISLNVNALDYQLKGRDWNNGLKENKQFSSSWRGSRVWSQSLWRTKAKRKGPSPLSVMSSSANSFQSVSSMLKHRNTVGGEGWGDPNIWCLQEIHSISEDTNKL